jgi:hypothetical protein
MSQEEKLAKARKAANVKIACKFCGVGQITGNIVRHERTCKKNTEYLESLKKNCPGCGKVFYKKTQTCSHACSNKYFRSGEDNGNWSGNSYRLICFQTHGKKCLICDEDKIVAAHHVNEDHTDNRPENIVPLCPTHHQYVHSRFRCEVQPIIDQYLQSFTGNPR